MKNKIFVGLAVIIVIGIVMVVALGFNVDYNYKNYTIVSLEIGKDFAISDMQSIAKDIFKGQSIEVNQAGSYRDTAIIKVNQISDENKEALISKVNEKYGTTLKVEDITADYVPSYRLRDVLKQFVVPGTIAILVATLYMVLKYRKIGSIKVFAQVIGFNVLAELLFAAIVAITRVPVNRIVVPEAILLSMFIIAVLANNYEKQIANGTEKQASKSI